jgi:peroxiredoxin Q/BCP
MEYAAVQVGDRAPAFSLSDDAGNIVSLGALKGKRVVLYFYPKDDTSGCTIEACEFRDLFPRFTAGDAVVLGVSPDSVASHAKFKAKYQLPFALLADTEHRCAEAYGVWQEKSMYGRKYMGMMRTTFVISPTGIVERVWEKVKHEGHAAEVAAFLRGETATRGAKAPTKRAAPAKKSPAKKK